MNTLRHTALLIIALMVAASLALARHDGAYLHEVTTKLQTPHVDYVASYAPGKPRVLFIVPRTIAPREIVELWQRFDLDFEAFTVAHSGLFSFESSAGAAPYDLAVEGTSIEEKTDELLGKLKTPYDVYVMANVNFDILPKEAQYRILKTVSDGAGMVFTFGPQTKLKLFAKPLTDGREQITTGVSVAQAKSLSQEDILKALKAQSLSELPEKMVGTFAFGKGRIATLNYGAGCGTYYGGHSLTPVEPYSCEWDATYDHLLSLVYKSIVWSTAGKRPTVTFSSLPEQGVSFERGSLPASLKVQLTSPAAVSGKLSVTIRDSHNALEAEQTLPLSLKAGATDIPIELPKLKAGGHFVNLALTSGKGVENWASIYCTVSSPLSFAGFGAASEFAEAGTQPPAQATLSAPAPANAAVQLTLTDTNDRLYLQRTVPVAAGQTAVNLGKLDLSGATTIASHLQGTLLVDKEPVASADQWLFVPRREALGHRDEFRSIIWGTRGDSGLGWMAMRQLRAAGFTDHLAHPSPTGEAERIMALNDMPLVCYAYRIIDSADENGWRKDGWIKDVEDGCFYNPELQQKAAQSVLDRIQNVVAYGPSLYSLGDENSFDKKGGFSPIALASFRKMLQGKYGSLERLNSVWGTKFAGWDAVKPLPKEEGIKQGLWPMVHDHMTFNEQEYADYHHFLRDVIRKADPGSWVGAEGSVPGDLEKTLGEMEIWGPYSDKRGNELLRSLADPQVVRGNWWGGYVGSHGGRAGAEILWRQLISGAVNTSLYFATTGAEGLLSADMSYAGYFEQLLPELREIYGGIGQLFAAATVPADGIAIHWSQASEHAADMFAAVGTPSASQGNLLGLLDRAGFGYRYVTTSGITGGGLDSDTRVLFLPCSLALSDEEAQRITAFVERGGIVISDVGAGLLDGNCKPRWSKDGAWQGQLDSLFGITRSGEPAGKSATASQTFGLAGGAFSLKDFPYRTDASVIAQAPTQVDGVPVFLSRSHGKGRVILLNFAFPNADHPDAVEFFRTMMAAVNVQPGYQLTESKGYLARRFELSDGLQIIGVARESKVAPDTTLRLARPAFAYDVRSGKPLGKQTEIKLPAGGAPVRIFSLLQAEPQPPAVSGVATVTRGAAAKITITLPAGVEGTVLRLQAFRPDGSEALPYRAYLTLKGREVSHTLPWAYSDPAGKWKVQVTNVPTGQTGSCTVTVR